MDHAVDPGPKPAVNVLHASPGLAPARSLALSPTRQLVLLLLMHTLLWTWVGVSSRSNFDVPGDMVEAYTWGQAWPWGYHKHPPLSAWITGLWFSVVPESHWGYSLLSATNGAVGLAGLAVLAREFLPRKWILLTVALASLAPGVTSLAMRFNANAVLISTWPWALAFAVRLMRTDRLRDAVLCGVACAAAMLGKYFSGALLLSIVVVALWLPHWRAKVLRTPALTAVAVFAVCMTPHLLWLSAQTHGPLQYAQAATSHTSPGTLVMRAFSFALAQVVFPVFAFIAMARSLQGPQRSHAFVKAITAPLRPSNEPVWLVAMLPIVTTMLGTVLVGARTASVWGLGMAAGLALLATYRARQAGADVNTGGMWRTLAVIWLVVAAASPVWWIARARLDTPSVTEPREELAHELQRIWRNRTGQPLQWVSGSRALAESTAFYAGNHPRYWSLWDTRIETPWVDTSKVTRDGSVIVCDTTELECVRRAEAWTMDRTEVSVAKTAHGFRFSPKLFLVFFIAPDVVVGDH
jgi:4-amino-4-deoxy-L-arabinose transferase-like glycosyltransferase